LKLRLKKHLQITNFKGTGAPNNPKAVLVILKGSQGFTMDLKIKDIHKVNVK